MKLGYLILYVRSVPDTIAFYEAAFGLERRMAVDSGDYGELNTGATKLAFASEGFVAGLTGVLFEAAAPSEAAPPLQFALVTDWVEAAYDRAVAAGARRPATRAQAVGPAGRPRARLQRLHGRDLLADAGLTAVATRPETVAYIVGQAAGRLAVTARKLFGEYALYAEGKLIALICGDQLFIKPTEPGRAFIAARSTRCRRARVRSRAF